MLAKCDACGPETLVTAFNLPPDSSFAELQAAWQANQFGDERGADALKRLDGLMNKNTSECTGAITKSVLLTRHILYSNYTCVKTESGHTVIKSVACIT